MAEIPIKSKKTKCIRVSEYSHSVISKYIFEEGEDIKIGRFFEKAALEKYEKLTRQKNPLSLLSGITLVQHGWKKEGSSAYKKGGDILFHDGVSWHYNGEQLNNKNYSEEIITGSITTFNPTLPNKKNK